MIVDKIENLSFYKPMLKNLDIALEVINSLEEYVEGRYEFDGGFYMVQKGTTKPMEEGTFESHKKYIDVQMVVDGSEDISWQDINDLEVEIPYNEEKDAIRYTGEELHNINITKGMCYVAFPHDGHKAVKHIYKEQNYVKIVLKLEI